MQRPDPEIVYSVPFGKKGLYRVIVEYPELDRNLYPYPLNNNFITKELKLEDNSHIDIRIKPILSEVFIHKTFKSPYLNIAEFVSIQNDIIVLFFNEAQSDLNLNKRSNFSTFKGWATSIVKGLVHLHLHRFLHGDIKSDNILVFDSIAKISDFGSSSLIIGKGKQRFNEKLYTRTHRPPEVWYDDEWDLSADIWALGCTLYEILYGEPLFQLKKTDDEYLKQINIWVNKPGLFDDGINFHKDWNLPIHHDVNMLILKMLNPDPTKRPTIFDIVKDPFFNSTPTEGTSPPTESSICKYKSLSYCPIIAQRLYNKECFNSNGKLLYIYNKLGEIEDDKETKMLVMCMYESFDHKYHDMKNLHYILLFIIHLISHRGISFTFNITKQTIKDILNCSMAIDFTYVNWSRFYGIQEIFRY
jgi:serine/threonine protein kinase